MAPSRHDMNSAGGFELLGLRVERLDLSDAATLKRVAEHNEALSKRLDGADDLNIRLAAHIIELNGKIVDLERTLSYEQAVIARQEAIVHDLQSQAKLDAEMMDKAASKIENLRSQVKMQREMSWRFCAEDAPKAIGGLEALLSDAELEKMKKAPPGGLTLITDKHPVTITGVDPERHVVRTIVGGSRREHRMGLHDDRCQDCGMSGNDVMMVRGRAECKGKPDGA